MIAYLWVAAGSALGGIARYAFGLYATRLWGPGFPWGTIAINVGGSFLIGFFGTLTLPTGGLPASTNLRTFVMVGICGGFTTFSSFSLQTMALAQAGAWIGAIGNVALSVAACLTSVTLGHATAARLGGRVAAPTMSARILAVLDRPAAAGAVLAAAGLVARRLGDARLEVLHVRHEPTQGFMPTEEVMSEAQNGGDGERLAADLHAAFAEWHRVTGLGVWREAAGNAAEIVCADAGDADVVILARPRPDRDSETRHAIDAALFDTDAAMLLIPDAGAPLTLGGHVAVAWKTSDAADRAIRAATPLLLAADQVTVITATEDGDDATAEPLDLLAALTRAGKPARRHRFPAAGRTVGAALMDEAARLGADLVVMGAYSRGRMADLVMGGATREILAGANLPVLMHR